MEPQTLYKNEILWAVNKPSHMHFNEVLTHCKREVWFPAHRLDFETSGILIYCLKSEFDKISALFKDPSSGLQKYYIAGLSQQPSYPIPNLIKGFIASRYRSSKSVKFIFDRSETRGWHSIRPAQMTIDFKAEVQSLASKSLKFKGFAHEVRLITGARHQIRATLKALGTPLIGDPIYNDQKIIGDDHPMELHAYKLVIPKSHGLGPSATEDLVITSETRQILSKSLANP